MRILRLLVFLLAVVFCIPILFVINAQIRINEIGIEQNPQTIELINSSSESADISHWYLDDSGGATYFTIPDNTYMYSRSCMIFTYDLNLNKSSPDTARLFDTTAQPTSNSAHLIDSYSYKSSPGNALTYARLPDGENIWATSEASFGLWNSTRENCIILPTSTPTPTITSTPIETLSPTAFNTPTPIISPTSYPNTYDFIYISEVMAYPEKNNPEWIELYNDDNFSVSLHDWYIDDLENDGSSPKLFSLEIPAKQYKVFELTSSLFNNDGDNVRLLDSEKKEKDSFEYIKAKQGKTYGRASFDSDMYCIQEPSKNMTNNSCIESTSQPTLKVNTIPINNSTIQSKKENTNTQKIVQTTYFFSPTVNNAQPLQSEILGENTQKSPFQSSPAPFYQTPFYISFSYSLLTIFSVLIKIKNAF